VFPGTASLGANRHSGTSRIAPRRHRIGGASRAFRHRPRRQPFPLPRLYAAPATTGHRPRNADRAQGRNPMILTLARGKYLPAMHRPKHAPGAGRALTPKIAVAYTHWPRIATGTTITHAAGVPSTRPAPSGPSCPTPGGLSKRTRLRTTPTPSTTDNPATHLCSKPGPGHPHILLHTTATGSGPPVVLRSMARTSRGQPPRSAD